MLLKKYHCYNSVLDLHPDSVRAAKKYQGNYAKKAQNRQNSLKSTHWIFTGISKILNEQSFKLMGKIKQRQYPFESAKLSTNFVHRC